MARLFIILGMLFLATAASEPSYAQAEQARLALIIANSDYNLDGRNDTSAGFSELGGFVTDLRNPMNDGRAMRAALTRLGFRVTYLENANRERMGTELALFGARIDAAPPDAWVVIYYSGHAIQVDGENYLIPAGAQIPREQDMSRLPSQRAASFISTYAIPTNQIFRQLRTPDVGGINLVVLDACRDNPWERRLYGRSRTLALRGLAEQAPRLGRTLVAYSTSPGDVAADGSEEEGSNSPYTEALLRWLPRPGFTVLQMLNNVGRDVLAATGQIPWMNNAPVEDICLAGCRLTASASSTGTEVSPPSVRNEVSQGADASQHRLDRVRTALGAISPQEWSVLEGTVLMRRLFAQLSIQDFALLAEGGDARAAFVIGEAYRTGIGVDRDFAQALQWLRTAASRGEPRAQASIGSLYYAGEGVPRDLAQALLWHRRAAEQGNAIGQNNVGASYLRGLGVPQDYLQAMSWYRRAADQGFAEAQYNIGAFYEEGRGVQADYARARYWYERAANQNHASAQFRLGSMHHAGRGVNQDPVEAMRWFRRAADQGLGVAQATVGSLYATGLGVPQNYQEALTWFRRGAAQNVAEAQIWLGYLYGMGLGVERDYVQSVNWYRRASVRSPVARFNLGLLLYAGVAGVARNQEEGLALITNAAGAGVQDARRWLAERGHPVPAEVRRAGVVPQDVQ